MSLPGVREGYPEWWNAKGDNSTDDTSALLSAGAASKSVWLSVGKSYRITASLASGIQSGQRWHGGGTITTADSYNHHVFDISGKTDVTVEGLVATAGTLGAAYSAATARFFRAVSSSHRCRLPVRH